MYLRAQPLAWIFLGIMGLAMGSSLAQSPDFQLVIGGELARAIPGDANHYEVVIDNLSVGTTSNQTSVDINLPSGIPCDVNNYLADDADAIAAFNELSNSIAISDSLFDDASTLVFRGLDQNCEFFLIQPSSLDVGANAHGTISFDTVVPPLPITTGSVQVHSPILDAELNYGSGGCEDGTDCHEHPCLGPRIPLMASSLTGTIELVDDGSSRPSEGCNSLTGFSSGNIALIDRGTCAFEWKIANAEFAGATAVIIADIDDFTDWTTEPDDVIDMGCSDFCSEELIVIPAAFISYNDGLRLHHNLGSGLTATIGRKDLDGQLITSARIWENSSTPDDTNQGNNSSSTTTMVVSADSIFSDGFEEANTAGWSSSTGETKALSRHRPEPPSRRARAISVD